MLSWPNDARLSQTFNQNAFRRMGLVGHSLEILGEEPGSQSALRASVTSYVILGADALAFGFARLGH